MRSIKVISRQVKVVKTENYATKRDERKRKRRKGKKERENEREKEKENRQKRLKITYKSKMLYKTFPVNKYIIKSNKLIGIILQYILKFNVEMKRNIYIYVHNKILNIKKEKES